jgi:hypothetical protein
MRVLITGIAALYLDDVLIKFETFITCHSADFHQTGVEAEELISILC